ncbi:MAG TPA: FAD-dependent oxidoreductase [archaeon]|nr:FAD-dependent oxidoreductase [archaeon]
MFDLLIIGAGPAGMSAAIYAARKKMNFLVISRDVGGQGSWSFCVENYPGVRKMSGIKLMKQFRRQLKEYDVKLKDDEAVKSIEKLEKGFRIATDKGSYEAKTIIITSGKNPKRLNVQGEEKFLGSGVAYCAVCDSPYFKDKDVAVVGGGNSGLDAVLHLDSYANRIYLIEVLPELNGDPLLVERIQKNDKVKIFTKTKILEITGDKTVDGIKIEQSGKEEVLDVQGVFIETGQIPNTDFIEGLVKLNEFGEIVVDRGNMTSVQGIFAAGDVTDIPKKQIVVAAGEGAKALLYAWDYLKRQSD